MIKKNIHKRLFSGLMAAVTAVSPITAYAADYSGIETVEEAPAETPESQTNFLFMNLKSTGGSLIINEGDEREQNIRLEEQTDGMHISVYDRNDILISNETAKDSGYTYVYEADADSIVNVKADADDGYNVSKYTVTADDAVEEDTDFKLNSEEFVHPVLMDENKTVTVEFAEKMADLTLNEEAEAEAGSSGLDEDITVGGAKEGVEDAEADGVETEGATEGEAPEEEGAEAETDGEEAASEETDEIMEEAVEDDIAEDVDGEDASIEEGTVEENVAEPEVSEEDTIEENAVEQEVSEESSADAEDALAEHFTEAVLGTENLDASKFSSARLVVLTSDADIVIDKEHMIANYGELYLMQYKTVEQAMNAYMYYSGFADAVEPDTAMEAASDITNITEGTAPTEETTVEVTESANPISTLSTESASPASEVSSKVIALIDTGVAGADNVIDRVSLIDDVLAGGTHGEEMLDAIEAVNPDAKVLSIRALSDDGKGTVSSIVAAMEYAINSNVDIINLSLYAKLNPVNSVLVSEIQKAVDAGITVVGAAGNDGTDVKNYIPGSVDSAYIIGASDENGVKLDSSNFGATVDYNVFATATSEAAAKFSGYVSLYGTDSIEVNNGMIFETGYTPINSENNEELISSPLYIAKTLQFVMGDEFNPETDIDDLKDYTQEGDEISLIFSDVDMTTEGLYDTVYKVTRDGEVFSIKRPVEVLTEAVDVGEKHNIQFMSDMMAGVNFYTERTDYAPFEQVRFSVTPLDGLKITDVKAYALSGENNQEYTEEDQVMMTIDTGMDARSEEEALYVNDNSWYCDLYMPDTDVMVVATIAWDESINAAAGADDELGKFTATQSSTVYAYHNSNVIIPARGSFGTYYRTVTYKYKDEDGVTQSKTTPLYCIQPGYNSTLPNGNTTYSSSNGSVIAISDKSAITKALYYLYGGPGWNKTFEDSDGNSVNMKTILDKYPSSIWAGSGAYYALTHLILGYCYAPSNPDAWNYTTEDVVGGRQKIWNDKGVAWLDSIREQLRKLPVPTTLFKRSGVDVTGSTWSKDDMTDVGDGVFRSPTMWYTAIEENTGTVTLPEGVAIRYDSVSHTGKVKMPGNTKFAIEIDTKTYTKSTFKLTLTAKYPVNFEAWKIITGANTQDLGFGYYTGNKTLSVSVERPDPTEEKWKVRVNAKKVDMSGNGLAGATFKLYYDQACEDPIEGVTALTSGADGMTNTVTVGQISDSKTSITIYCKETKAPDGYAVSKDVYSVKFTKAKYDELFAADNNTPGELKTVGPTGGIPNPTVTPTPSTTPKITPTTPPPGGSGVYVHKTTTANDEIMDLDSYTLADAEFSVTSNRGFSGTLTTDESGNSNVLSLPDNHTETWVPAATDMEGNIIREGYWQINPVKTTYYVRETKAPDGHNPNNATKSFTVTMPDDKDALFTVDFEDEPYFCDDELDIEKLGVKGEVIEGAVFQIQYYDADSADSNKLKKTWFLKSDASGHVKMDNAHLDPTRSSDSFFTHNGKIVIPVGGCLDIMEVAAPAEYTVTTKPKDIPTTKDADFTLTYANGKAWYEEYERCKINIQKYEDDGVTPISGVEFEIKFLEQTITPTSKKHPNFQRLLNVGETLVRHTDSDGKVFFDNLDQGKYQITEIHTQPGRALLKEPIIVTVPFQMTNEEAMEYGNVDFSSAKEDAEYTGKWFFFECLYEITNNAVFTVPMTGSTGTWMLGFIGIGVLMMTGLGWILYGNKIKKVRKRHERKLK